MKYLLDRGAIRKLNEQEIAWAESFLGMTVKGLWNFSWWLGGRIRDNQRKLMIQGKAALYAGVYISACDEALAKMGGKPKEEEQAASTTEESVEIQKAIKAIKVFREVIPVLASLEKVRKDAPAQPAADAGAAPAADSNAAPAPAPAPAAENRLPRAVLQDLIRQHPYLSAAHKVTRIQGNLTRAEQQSQAHPGDVALEQKVQDLKAALQEAKDKSKEIKDAFIAARDEAVRARAAAPTNENAAPAPDPAAAPAPAPDAQPAQDGAQEAHTESADELLQKYIAITNRVTTEGINAILALREAADFKDNEKVQLFVKLFDELPMPAADGDDDEEDAGDDGTEAEELTPARLYKIIDAHNGEEAGKYVHLLETTTDATVDALQEAVDDMWESNDDTQVPESFEMFLPAGTHQQAILEGGGDYSKSFKTFLGSGIIQKMLKKYPKTDEFKKLATSLVNVKRLKRYQFEASIYYSMEGTKEEYGHTLAEDNKRVINPNLKIVWDRLMMRLDDYFQFYIDVDAINAKVKVQVLDPKTVTAAQSDAALYLEAKKAGIDELVRKMVGYDGTTVYGFGIRNDHGSGYAVMRKVKDSRHMAVQYHWYKMFGAYELGEDDSMKRSNMFGQAVTEACKADGFVYVAFSTTSTTAGKKPAYFYDKKGRMIMKQPYNMDDSEVQQAITAAKNTNPTTSDAFRNQMVKSVAGAHWRQVGVTLRGIVNPDRVMSLYRLDLSKDMYKQDFGLEDAKDNHTKLVKVFQSLSSAAHDDPDAGATAPANESIDQGPNDEQQIKSREYEEKIKEFNAKKGQLDQVMTKAPQDWEKLAEPIIGNNLYLGMAWRIAKLTRSLDTTKQQLPAKQGEEVARAQDDIRATEKELKSLQEEMKKHIDEDKKTLGEQV